MKSSLTIWGKDADLVNEHYSSSLVEREEGGYVMLFDDNETAKYMTRDVDSIIATKCLFACTSFEQGEYSHGFFRVYFDSYFNNQTHTCLYDHPMPAKIEDVLFHLLVGNGSGFDRRFAYMHGGQREQRYPDWGTEAFDKIFDEWDDLAIKDTITKVVHIDYKTGKETEFHLTDEHMDVIETYTN